MSAPTSLLRPDGSPDEHLLVAGGLLLLVLALGDALALALSARFLVR